MLIFHYGDNSQTGRYNFGFFNHLDIKLSFGNQKYTLLSVNYHYNGKLICIFHIKINYQLAFYVMNYLLWTKYHPTDTNKKNSQSTFSSRRNVRHPTWWYKFRTYWVWCRGKCNRLLTCCCRNWFKLFFYMYTTCGRLDTGFVITE
jgi:hypothetical protein